MPLIIASMSMYSAAMRSCFVHRPSHCIMGSHYIDRASSPPLCGCIISTPVGASSPPLWVQVAEATCSSLGDADSDVVSTAVQVEGVGVGIEGVRSKLGSWDCDMG